MDKLAGQEMGYQTLNSTTQTFSSIKHAIAEMTKAMKADYPLQFIKIFASDEELNAYKNRILTELKGVVSPEDLVNGYEECISQKENHDYLPTVPKIVFFANAECKKRLLAEKKLQESRYVSALPAPTIECNPIEMLAKAKSSGSITADERVGRVKAHEALIAAHKAAGKIRSGNVDSSHKCSYGACGRVGTISNATSGHGNYYCAEHFRLA